MRKFARTKTSVAVLSVGVLVFSSSNSLAASNVSSQIGYLLVSSFDKEPNGKIYLARSDSSLFVQDLATDSVVHTPNRNFKAHSFNWSPNGSQIIFTQSPFINVESEIYMMSMDGTNLKRLTNNKVHERDPVWSPDGTKIAFAREVQPGVLQIFVMNSDGTNQTRLTNIGEEGAFFPSWSPDGLRIAFVGSVGGVGEIFTMNADGSNVHQITSERGSFNPRWSPDGTKLAYASYDSTPSSSIWISNPDGSNKFRITQINTGEFAKDPSWSPNGEKILFLNYGFGATDVYLINTDGSNLTKVISGPLNSKLPAQMSSPRWKPQN